MEKLATLLQRSAQNKSDICDYVGQNQERIISDWAYAFGSSNMGTLGSSTLALSRVLALEDLPHEIGSAISLKIVDEGLKIIYRALTQARPALTLPALSLLQGVAQFAPIELTTQFDFTLRIIPKLLTSAMFREGFLKFYIQLIRSAPAHIRKDLLSTRNVFSAWIGKLGQENEPEIVRNTMDVFKELVLKDVTTFSKTSKMGLFNDWTLKNMVRLLGQLGSSDPELANEIASFLIMLFCDKHYGVRMAGENALAKSFLKIVKPWENTIQMDLVVRLLREMPDLVLPHFDALAPVYPLTPKASMWWYSYSVLCIRVMKLDTPFIPADTDGFAPPPSIEVVSKTLLPVTATKTALQQAFQFKDSKLVQFQAAQIVLLALQRLRKAVKEVYEPRKWDSTKIVDEILQNRLPDVHMFTKAAEPDLLMTVYLAIVREFCLLRPQNINLQIPLEAKEVNGLALVQAENLLEIQTLTSDQTKWWNPSKDEPSLFTQLLKFATFNPKLAEKSSKLVQYLVDPTQLFADIQTMAHPVDGLLLSLSDNKADLVWPLLDQSVQRAVRTPYQYIDKVRSGSVSPFAVALMEQYTTFFADRDGDNLARQLLYKFLRSLLVLGEDGTVISKFLDEFGGSKSNTSLLGKDDYFNFVLDASDQEILKRPDLVFKITNSLELAATLFRISESSSSEVQNYLLASIPEDMLDLLTTPAAYRNFINGPKDVLYSYLAILEDRNSEELSSALELSPHWELGISRESSDFLVSKAIETHDPRIVRELNSRGIQLSLEAVHVLLNVDGIAENLLLRGPLSVSADEAMELMAAATNANVMAALVTVSGFYDRSSKLAESAPVLTAAVRYAANAVDKDVAIRTAIKLIDDADPAGIQVLSEMRDQITIPSRAWEALASYVEGSKSNPSQSALVPELVQLVSLDPPYLTRWLKIVVLQLTRSLAESRFNASHLEFISVFNRLALDELDIWAHVHPNALNALVDACIRHSCEPETFAMAARIALQGKSRPLEASGHLATLLDTEGRTSTTEEEIVLIYALFNADTEANSTVAVEQGILGRFSGSVKAVDQVLLHILAIIESNRQRSWVDNVQSWEIRPARANLALIADDYGTDPLIMLKGNDVFVTLDEVRVRETIQQFELHRPWAAPTDANFQTIVQSLAQYDLLGGDGAPQRYDSMFLLNTVVSCEYLLERPELFLTSGLLSFVICCLADEGLNDTAFRVLAHESKEIQERKFKDQIGMLLAINKVLTLHAQRREKGAGVPPYLAVMIGQLVQVVARPGHFMHEKVSGWLLEGPSVLDTDIPLFNMVRGSVSDSKPRELVWLVNAFASAAVDDSAIEAYAKHGVIEWCLAQAQTQSPKSAALRAAVDRFLGRIEELHSGSTTLATRFGGLVVPGVAEPVVCSAPPQSIIEWTH